jgi:ribonuclease HI
MKIGMAEITIYTDGAASGNPGPGGFGVVLKSGPYRKEIAQGFRKTTNNRMELLSVISALERLKESCRITLTSDSKYVLDGLSKGWARSWRSKGWKKSDGSPALNPDLWERLLNLCDKHEIEYVWVKGHAGHPYNERCDSMAQAESGKYVE